ncbi:zinc transporter 6 [Amia ocellicauda]|uniref:zinc transporter 6 n=1 Tax=Amia ocellicauda TaxID=2972642 RepID=UPI0034649902|nr:ZNT6 protein [Amia calva]
MATDGSSTSPAGLPYHNVGDYYPRKLGPKPDVVPSGVTERKVSPLDKPDMVAVDVINIKESDIPLHRKKQETDTYVLGTIHPFRKSQRSFYGKFVQEFRLVAGDRRSWKILLFGFLNIICTGFLLMWCSSTNSMALTAYSYLTIFDLFSLITCLISSWVTMKKPSPVYSFGFERFEVLAVFASTVLAQLGALFILKESVERFVEQPEIHTGRLLVGTFVALSFNLLTMLLVKNKPFVYVSEAASTSWLQEHVADLSRSVCGVIPGLSSVLLPRMNPFVLIDLAGALALWITYMLIEINNYNAVDTASAVAIALMTFGTMYPMSVYSGKVLLQTTPSHVIGQLDKLLREVSTLDGVLEVRNEHFWTIGFGSLAGSVHVRIRRDANEQLVLAHVTNRLYTLVSSLTVQIFKDDWIRPSMVTGPLPTGMLHPSDYTHLSTLPPPKPVVDHDPLTSTPAKPSSPPPEFSFNTPGKNINPVVLPSSQPSRPYGMGLNYGAAPYHSAMSHSLGRSGGGLGVGVGMGVGVGSAQGFRTGEPHRYATHPTMPQFGQYKP